MTRWDRRQHARMLPELVGWQPTALLRPGHDVMLVNIGAGGALMRSRHRMAPGSRVELHLFGDIRHRLRGQLTRCRVVDVATLAYEGAVRFDALLSVEGARRSVRHG